MISSSDRQKFLPSNFVFEASPPLALVSIFNGCIETLFITDKLLLDLINFDFGILSLAYL